MGQAIDGCTGLVAGRGGTYTVDALQRLAEPTAKRLERLGNDFGARLNRLQSLRGTPAFARAAASVEADINARIGNDRADIESVIEKVRAEGTTELHELTEGPTKDTDAYVSSYTLPWAARFIRFDCINTNYGYALDRREAEANATATMYGRLRHAYERLRPSQPDDRRLPFDPMVGNDGD